MNNGKTHSEDVDGICMLCVKSARRLEARSDVPADETSSVCVRSIGRYILGRDRS